MNESLIFIDSWSSVSCYIISFLSYINIHLLFYYKVAVNSHKIRGDKIDNKHKQKYI